MFKEIEITCSFLPSIQPLDSRKKRSWLCIFVRRTQRFITHGIKKTVTGTSQHCVFISDMTNETHLLLRENDMNTVQEFAKEHTRTAQSSHCLLLEIISGLLTERVQNSLDQKFSTRGNLSAGDIWEFLEMFLAVTTREDTTGFQWVEVRNAVLICIGQSPPHTYTYTHTQKELCGPKCQ